MDTKALRQKILDLAIRGKLVPQDPNDEPASILLERIRAEKQQMVKAGKLKPKDIKNDTVIFKGEDNLHYEKFADGSVKCIEDEISFDIPDGWCWSRGFSCFLGMESQKPCDEYFDYIDIDAIDNKRHCISSPKKTFTNKAPSRASRKLNNGSILFSMVRPYLENIAYIDYDLSHCIASTGFYVCNPSAVWNSKYLFLVMISEYVISGLNQFMKGDNSPSIKQSDIENWLYPIPPLNEQKRILDCANKSLLLNDNIITEVTELTEMVSIAKSKILDLAIRGKLVPQDPNDEPASVLLERIRAEKEELIKQGKIKRDKKESVIFKGEDNSYYEKIGDTITCIDDELPFEIPDNWTWSRGISCFAGMNSKNPTGESFKYIDIDSIDNKNHCVVCPKKLDVKNAPSRAKRAVENGSVVFSLVRPYLENIAFIDETLKDCIASTGFYICNSNGVFYPKFMFYLMTSKYVVLGLNQYMKGDNSPSISKENIENWLFPIPPYNEQKKLVNHINTLQKYIQNIEASLN